jgi:hypothetical protein
MDSELSQKHETAGDISQWQQPPKNNPVRASVRFPLQLAVTLETEEGPIEALTVDVSANGLLFEADKLPQDGSKIVFTMTMPSKVMGSANDVSVHCIGRIVRHQEVGMTMRAAAVIDEYFLKV